MVHSIRKNNNWDILILYSAREYNTRGVVASLKTTTQLS